MRIFNRATIQAYADRHPDAASGVWGWFRSASSAKWTSFAQVRVSDPSVSLVGDRLVFNVNGNRHRIVVRVDWDCGLFFIRFIGSHAEYDRINVSEA